MSKRNVQKEIHQRLERSQNHISKLEISIDEKLEQQDIVDLKIPQAYDSINSSKCSIPQLNTQQSINESHNSSKRCKNNVITYKKRNPNKLNPKSTNNLLLISKEGQGSEMLFSNENIMET